ncbi:MAG: hypothetical protein L6309_05545 [Candidatus Omnitrophica bacterium]|nr:hypothetical protein [Candidatus Omnitrophota bacterium]
MKILRGVFIAITVAGMIVALSYPLLAEDDKEWQEKCEAKVKVLKDSAAVLQKTNPQLAIGLNKCADEKTKMMQEWKEQKDRYEAREKLLSDSAAALKQSNPELAKKLEKMSKNKHGEKMHKMKKEKRKEDD